jgi:hypothetical protein
MKMFASVLAMLLLPAVIAANPIWEPFLFMDFDPDGMEDYEILNMVDLGFFEPATLYIGVQWTGFDMSAAEYGVHYGGAVVPGVTAYDSQGVAWALTIGNLLDGGLFQSGPCRDATVRFITALSVTGTGAHQTFDFVRTAAPYEFPGLFQLYDCTPDIMVACAMSNAACNGAPNPVDPELNCAADPVEPTSWGVVKSLFK